MNYTAEKERQNQKQEYYIGNIPAYAAKRYVRQINF